MTKFLASYAGTELGPAQPQLVFYVCCVALQKVPSCVYVCSVFTKSIHGPFWMRKGQFYLSDQKAYLLAQNKGCRKKT